MIIKCRKCKKRMFDVENYNKTDLYFKNSGEKVMEINLDTLLNKGNGSEVIVRKGREELFTFYKDLMFLKCRCQRCKHLFSINLTTGKMIEAS